MIDEPIDLSDIEFIEETQENFDARMVEANKHIEQLKIALKNLKEVPVLMKWVDYRMPRTSQEFEARLAKFAIDFEKTK